MLLDMRDGEYIGQAGGSKITGYLEQYNMTIAWTELYALVTHSHDMGHFWEHQEILFKCDSHVHAVVDIWEKVVPSPPRSWLSHHKLACFQHNLGTADAISHFQDVCFKNLGVRANLMPDSSPT